MNGFFAIVSFFLFWHSSVAQKSGLLDGTGVVSFISEAPLENIRATSNQLKGILDLSNNTFAFSFPVNSFNGFNSPLQKTHFNEHYLESEKYANASYTGKLLNFYDCDNGCTIDVISKGKLTIHGITKVMTIPVTIAVEKDVLSSMAQFEVQLSDFDIEIPLILEGKISPLIKVQVEVKFPTDAN